ncbi:glycosyltransferase family 4 protein [Aminobacter anthyllidis]|uniref:glycosyltransferase family 4 protein n=1 Tax=Aminobacter anthyllidis TaxID=1035067 RepID=UPI0024548FC2|nr:glycosyltransferase family 4 protein [Aminobacter anthyllidis]MDH4985112.1 glycosyltransferase family 4 protein [Aminobacter anthyllidis]
MHAPTNPIGAASTVDSNRLSTSRRILLVASDAVWPPISGGDLRNWQNAKALATLGDVLATSVHEPSVPAKLDDTRITTLALANAAEAATSPRLAKRQTPIDTRIPQIALSRLLAAARDFRPDTIVVEGIPLFPLLRHLRPLAPTLVLDMHNIESDLARQMMPKTGWLAGLFSKTTRHVRRMRDMELQSLRVVDKVWVCSEQDRDRLRSLSGGRAIADVIPNGVPRFDLIPEQLVDQPEMDKGKPTLLFIGHLNYPPNLEAARRLATQILPRLQAKLGGARLIIAGRSPHRSLADVAALPDVELIANPDDLAELYSRAHLAIVPLVSGGGTRLKILEAMAWGLPVVATRLAAEGLGLVDGVDIDFAETNDELATRAAALCTDPGWLQARRLRARETVTRRFGPQAISSAVRASLL